MHLFHKWQYKNIKIINETRKKTLYLSSIDGFTIRDVEYTSAEIMSVRMCDCGKIQLLDYDGYCNFIDDVMEHQMKEHFLHYA